MPKDDYFRVVYRILNTLYEYMKRGLAPDTGALNAAALGIEDGYRDQVLANLLDDGYVKGISATSYFGGESESGHTVIENLEGIAITTKGMEYLKDNTMMKRVQQFLKGAKEIIPGA